MRLQNLDMLTIVAKFMPEQYKQLNATDLMMLNQIPRMALAPYQTKGALQIYTTVCQKTLARLNNRTRETISRSTTKLSGLGLLFKQQRRKVRGKWQSCIYKLGKELWGAISRFFGGLSSGINRVTSTSHIVSETIQSKTANKELSAKKTADNNLLYGMDGELAAILERLSKKVT